LVKTQWGLTDAGIDVVVEIDKPFLELGATGGRRWIFLQKGVVVVPAQRTGK